MIQRTNSDDRAKSEALFSDCEHYRYRLTRVWDAAGGKLHFVMLNPSTADEFRNDPTVERCERRARTLGYGAFRVTNIFAFRATDPKVMRAAADPVGGSANDVAILEGANWADATVCAWGTHGAYLNRGQAVEALLRDTHRPLLHLGLSKAGHPKHPLYIAYAQQPEAWE
ncbi:DUF1643 domain-containing protein [Pontivivens insulae]|uniref:DUF1643 domain-containing protein n=1 Tax=Pontivivens insulae TaxID=1639689 RepID=A0A2R8AF09_9RHOB|nr:DUF1643 domain-containing protein [Pontivivens insulae]RED12063.1 hypothetical protein DFR53_2776 [Pontivivens insulae]SPF30819.1 hypothetical protein POI8812_03163 [Pontivivens insulae]